MSRNHIHNVLVFASAISMSSCIAKEVTSPLEFPFMHEGHVHQYPRPTELDSRQDRELGLSSFRGTKIPGNDALLLVSSRPKMDEKSGSAYLIQSVAPIWPSVTPLSGSKPASSLSQSQKVLRAKLRDNGYDNESFVHNSKYVTGDRKPSFDSIYNSLMKELSGPQNYEEDERNYPKAKKNAFIIGGRQLRTNNSPLEEYKLLRRLRSPSGSKYNGGRSSTFGRLIALRSIKAANRAKGDQSDYFLRFLPRSNLYDKY